MAAAPAAAAPPPPLLGLLPLMLGRMVAMDPGQHARHKEEHAVHNPQREAPLEHSTSLAHGNPHPLDLHIPEDPKIEIHRGPAHDGGAVGAGDEAQVVDGGDQGADKGQVDERDELRVGLGAVVAEEGADGPGESEDGDDEEEEDVGGRHDVGFEMQMDKVGEHAHDGDLAGD